MGLATFGSPDYFPISVGVFAAIGLTLIRFVLYCMKVKLPRPFVFTMLGGTLGTLSIVLVCGGAARPTSTPMLVAGGVTGILALSLAITAVVTAAIEYPKKP